MLGKIVLLGEPKSTQHVYKITCRPYPTIYMSAEGKSIKSDYEQQAKEQWQGRAMIDEPFGMTVRYFHKTKRKQDIDNFAKIMLDSMSRTVFSDDNLIYEMHSFKFHDPLSPRIEIEFFALA